MAVILGEQDDDVIGPISELGLDDATAGADTIYGLNGDDILKGIGGADTIYGGNGNDVLAGFGGLSGSDGNADYLEGGLGNDSASGDEGDDDIFGGGGNDALRGDQGNDSVYGNDGIDRLEGGDGDDILHGGEGDERGAFQAPNSGGTLVAYEGGLFGGDGNDAIHGDDGNDDIIGGLGTDAMYGGRGQDTFFFASIEEIGKGSTSDLIGDFRRKDGDLIDLSAIDAKEGGSDNKFKYIGDDDFSDKKGELKYKNGKLSGDTDGDGKADFTLLVNTNKMVGDDFVL